MTTLISTLRHGSWGDRLQVLGWAVVLFLWMTALVIGAHLWGE